MSRAREFADLAGSADAGGLTGRNLIINGACVIDQRNGGASVNNNAYAVDRFLSFRDGTTVAFTSQRSTTVPSGAGFVNSLLITTTTSGTAGAGEGIGFQQRIEGFNVANLMWGTANAKTVTLSFWVRSSLTGTFSGSLVNSSFNRSYPYTFTISSANTWEQKTVTVAGDTSGTWLTDNGTGIRVYWDMGSGTSLKGTANAWASAGYVGATGAVNVVGTSGATFYITGVQLEVGDTATPFEHRSYGDELARCQRYYLQQAIDIQTPIGGYMIVPIYFPTTMRAAPATFAVAAGTTAGGLVSEGISGLHTQGAYYQVQSSANSNYRVGRIDAYSAEL
jgi:hypothetical protein